MNPFFFMHQRSMGKVLILIFFSVIVFSISPSYGFDPLDPYGNITVTWDFLTDNGATFDEDDDGYLPYSLGAPGWVLFSSTPSYLFLSVPDSESNDCKPRQPPSGTSFCRTWVVSGCCWSRSLSWTTWALLVRVSIHNFQLYRHVEKPGWRLSWAWKGDEVIWSMWGAEATEQGNCSRFKGQEKPHCCEKEPTIIDLMPGTPYNMQVPNCCKQGVLSSMTQDPTKTASFFQMNFNKPSIPIPDNITMPENFTLGIPGYSCGKPVQVPPTKLTTDGRRWTQVLDTWNVTCTYSQFLASPAPKCCVSLSAFYNSTIVPCPKCSCNCQGLPGANCVNSGEASSLLQLPQDLNTEEPPPLVRCSQHMCPIRVHWHVKQSYTEYWRVKITITNLNFVKNYSQWNLVLLHPNLQSITQVFSFNYQPLRIYGDTNDTGMFWGIKYYNDMLLTYGENGNVQTEMLLHKDPGNFTFKEGWAFPRRVSFNGDECVMPSPDHYPTLPNTAHFPKTSSFFLFFSFLLSILLW